MKLAFLACLAGSVLLATCVHTRQVGYDMDQLPPEDMLQSLIGEEVTVELRSSGTLTGTLLPGSSDTVRLRAADPDTNHYLPIDAIASN